MKHNIIITCYSILYYIYRVYSNGFGLLVTCERAWRGREGWVLRSLLISQGGLKRRFWGCIDKTHICSVRESTPWPHKLKSPSQLNRAPVTRNSTDTKYMLSHTCWKVRARMIEIYVYICIYLYVNLHTCVHKALVCLCLVVRVVVCVCVCVHLSSSWDTGFATHSACLSFYIASINFAGACSTFGILHATELLPIPYLQLKIVTFYLCKLCMVPSRDVVAVQT